MTTEVWKPVFGFEGRYEVSSFGRFKALARKIYYVDGRQGSLSEKLLRGSLLNVGYIAISFDSKARRLAHQIVAETFLGAAEYRQTVNHKDGNKTNNRVDNLEWATYRENNAHARKTGLNNQHGEKCNLHKHSDQFIQAVRNVHAKFHPSYVDMAEMFGLHKNHVREIVLNLTRAKPA
jgi:hypothetical protein